jgi:hypothetical protein
MHCQVAFKYEHICDEFPKTFWQKEYKKHRETMLFDMERAQCVATLPYVQMVHEQDAIRDDLRAVNDEIKRLRRLLQLNIRRQVELNRRFVNLDPMHVTRAAPQTAEYHTPCNTPDCRGFVTKKEPQCACCKQRTCHNCHQTVEPDPDTEHECKADDVATVQELRRNSKQCPECRVNISKIDGCDQMFCVSCHTAFSWNTGQRVTGPIHNPHYFEVRAQLGANFPVRNGGEGVCDDALPDVRYFRNTLSQETITRDSETTLRYATHIRQVTIPELRANGAREYSFRTNLRNRVAWMLKQRSDDEFKLILYRNDKKSRFHSELLALFQMYVNVIGTLYNNIVVERSMRSYPDVQMLKRYTREQLLAIKGRYNSTSTSYDRYLSDMV